MNNRDWSQHWNSINEIDKPASEAALYQVGKTVMGKPVAIDQIAILVSNLIGTLELNDSSDCLDLGCGNGLITSRISPGVRKIVGYDYSRPLLNSANKHFSDTNIEYKFADLRNPETIAMPKWGFTYIYSVEVLQNLEYIDLVRLLEYLQISTSGNFKFLVSGIPDKAKIRDFYNTEERWQHYLDSVRVNREQIGKWWDITELKDAANEAGVNVSVLPLEKEYYTAHYRGNALYSGKLSN